MSQFFKMVHVSSDNRYLFRVVIDHAPDRGEVGDIEQKIKRAMFELGVRADRVGVVVAKGDPPFQYVEYQSDKIFPLDHYLICFMRWTKPGGFTEDVALVEPRMINAYSNYLRVEPDNIRAIVLEDCYLEVESFDGWTDPHA